MQVEYKNNLLEVSTWLSDAGLTLKEAKCEFGMTEVQYLGYQVSSCGLEPLAEQILPVKNAPAPTCVSKLKSYLGMLTYYNRFLPNVSTVLWTGMEWEWTTEHDRAFKTTKEMLKAASVLTHYNPSKPCFLVMRLPMVLELCYHISVTVGRKCQSRLRQVSFMPVSDVLPNWIRRGCQWFLACVNFTSIWKGFRRIISPYWGC